MRYTAKPSVKRRLVILNGGTQKYIDRFIKFLTQTHRDPEIPAWNFLWQCIVGRKPTPAWLVADLIRYLERSPEWDVVEAMEHFEEWFFAEEGGQK